MTYPDATPPTAPKGTSDVREALAVLLRSHEHSQTSFAHNLRWHRATADAILAAFEVRPRGPVTDAEVDAAYAAVSAYAKQDPMAANDRTLLRVALEAAREVQP